MIIYDVKRRKIVIPGGQDVDEGVLACVLGLPLSQEWMRVWWDFYSMIRPSPSTVGQSVDEGSSQAVDEGSGQAVDEGVVVGLGVWCKGEPSQHSHDHVTSAELTVYLLH